YALLSPRRQPRLAGGTAGIRLPHSPRMASCIRRSKAPVNTERGGSLTFGADARHGAFRGRPFHLYLGRRTVVVVSSSVYDEAASPPTATRPASRECRFRNAITVPAYSSVASKMFEWPAPAMTCFSAPVIPS